MLYSTLAFCVNDLRKEIFMSIYAVKFGGTSLADAGQFRKVRSIIEANPARRFIVVSAPGKRRDGDIKVTDMLEDCLSLALSGGDFETLLEKVKRRYTEIADDLGVNMDFDSEFNIIATCLTAMPHRDYTLSRGEYLSAKLMAAYLGRPFVDPAKCVCFDENGALDEDETQALMEKTLAPLDGAVIAGFYGKNPDGSIKTFSRGGSDVTGALVARAVSADLYENWTDVSGLMDADPRIVPSAKCVESVSYRELRILSYMGASVLHTDAVKPVSQRGIPINIKNTNRPEDAGTLIVPELPREHRRLSVTGVAGRKGLSVLQVEKSMVSDGAGFTAVLLDVFKRHRVPFEQCLTGIDTITIVIRSELLRPRQDDIIRDIARELDPDTLKIIDHLSMITVVGENAADSADVSAKLIGAVQAGGIHISTINQGAGRLNLIIGVAENDYSRAIQLLHGAISEMA